MRHKRWSWILVAWLVASWVVADIAFAEDARSTYIEGAFTGFNSKPWNDNDQDNAATTVRFSNCRLASGGAPRNFQSTRIEMRKINDFRPDDNVGERTLLCFTSDTGSWGDMPRSRYKFRINLINDDKFCCSMNADPVRISW